MASGTPGTCADRARDEHRDASIAKAVSARWPDSPHIQPSPQAHVASTRFKPASEAARSAGHTARYSTTNGTSPGTQRPCAPSASTIEETCGGVAVALRRRRGDLAKTASGRLDAAEATRRPRRDPATRPRESLPAPIFDVVRRPGRSRDARTPVVDRGAVERHQDGRLRDVAVLGAADRGGVEDVGIVERPGRH